MNYKIKQRGSSLVEVLIYVAIVAIIGTILTGYFMVAVNSEAEHAKRNAINSSVENIVSTLKYDLMRSTRVGVPSLLKEATSTLIAQSEVGVFSYYIDVNKALVKQYGTTTVILTEPSVSVSDLLFKRQGYYEERLNATTTSIELNMILKNKQIEKMTRTINMTFLVGKDTL